MISHMLKRIDTTNEDWTVIHCHHTEEADSIVRDAEFIWPLIWRSALRMVNEQHRALMVLEIRCVEMSDSIWVSLQYPDLTTSLQRMLNWREEREEYEECAQIAELIQRSQQRYSLAESD